jgi:6-phosphogluconolactonase
MTRLLITPDAEHAAQTAATLVDTLIGARLRETGEVHLALAGGTTPRRAYELLATLRTDWTGIHLWFGDERMVPLENDDANASMVHHALVSPAQIPATQVHTIPTDLGPRGACDAYSDELYRLLPAGSAGIPALDIAVLGLGEDGHTASLFPGSPALLGAGSVCVVVEDAPKPPPVRITLTMAMLNTARTRIVLATGAGKADAVAAAMAEPDPLIPASLLARDATTWILDAAAASALDEGTRDA